MSAVTNNGHRKIPKTEFVNSLGYTLPSRRRPRYVRNSSVISTGRCNTGIKPLCRGFKAQRLARPLI